MRPFNLDDAAERFARKLAIGSSRRGFLSRIAGAVAISQTFPLLPIDRAQAADPAQKLTDFQKNAQTHDDTRCNYWRYCGIDGMLCSCCGGGVHTCPPGTTSSLTSWIGTCYNPDDRKMYLIAYRDCCGTSQCTQCQCDNTDETMPKYRPQGANEITWCFGTSSFAYHCSTAALVGEAG